MCLRMFSRYLPELPSSILDIGCGTGYNLDILSHICPDCWGIDYMPEAIESAAGQYPHLNLKIKDMRSIRLGRTFDVITCMGSGLMYARSNEDISRILETFVAHAHTGTLLILDVLNAASFPSKRKSKELNNAEINSPKFSAAITSMSNFNRYKQLPVRQRMWNIPGQSSVEDCCRYKAFFPNEIKQLLTKKGFKVVGIFDNIELKESDLYDLKLYVSSIMS